MAPATEAAKTRELAAIMFSDIAGYTAIMGRDEQEGLDARNAHRELLRTILPRFKGRLIGDLGDGALSSFHSAIDAVNCARVLQAATGNDAKLKIRVGIHLGDVLFSDNTVLGDGVNVASRLVALAEPGGICISEKVYDEIRNQRGMSVRSLGTKTLKNVARPVGVYALDRNSNASTVAVASSDKRTTAVVALAGVGALAVAVIYFAAVRKAAMPTAAPSGAASATAPHPIQSIAVLPLDNFSGDPNQEYFADGMTDELTTDLAKLGALRVISRGSAMRFRGPNRPPTPEIAKILNVDALVEGSVLRSGDKVRITAQLIDALADKHLWADSFERDSRDVLALQDELASAIAKQIQGQLTPAEQSRLTGARLVNPAAHDAYLKGRYFINRTSDENLLKAIEQFETAIKLDPTFAPAFAGVSDAYLWAGVNEGVITAAQALPKAKEAAERAVQLDGNSAEAHASLANYLWSWNGDWKHSEAEFQRAIQLNPNYAFAHDQLAQSLASQGRLDEALAENRRATEIDPLSLTALLNKALTLAWQGKYDEAADQGRRQVELDPSVFLGQWTIGWVAIERGDPKDAAAALEKAAALECPPYVRGFLGYALGAAGDRARAMQQIEELKKRAVRGYVPAFNLAIVHLGMGDRETALSLLEKAAADQSEWLMLLKMDRMFDPLRKEPRFITLLRKWNFE